MSVETELIDALIADPAVAALIGSAGKILSGNMEKRLPLPPPLVLIEVMQGTPEIVGEEGILVDSWDCGMWLICDVDASPLEHAVSAVMEECGFERRGTRRLDGGRVERECLELRFAGYRMRT